MAKDKVQEVIDRYLGHPQAEPDEIDDVLADYTSQHASERLARQRRKATPDRAGLTRRATSLTVMSPNSAFQSVVATLSEDERLVLGDDGFSVEVVAGVGEDEELEGTIEVILND